MRDHDNDRTRLISVIRQYHRTKIGVCTSTIVGRVTKVRSNGKDTNALFAGCRCPSLCRSRSFRHYQGPIASCNGTSGIARYRLINLTSLSADSPRMRTALMSCLDGLIDLNVRNFQVSTTGRVQTRRLKRVVRRFQSHGPSSFFVCRRIVSPNARTVHGRRCCGSNRIVSFGCNRFINRTFLKLGKRALTGLRALKRD